MTASLRPFIAFLACSLPCSLPRPCSRPPASAPLQVVFAVRERPEDLERGVRQPTNIQRELGPRTWPSKWWCTDGIAMRDDSLVFNQGGGCYQRRREDRGLHERHERPEHHKKDSMPNIGYVQAGIRGTHQTPGPGLEPTCGPEHRLGDRHFGARIPITTGTGPPRSASAGMCPTLWARTSTQPDRRCVGQHHAQGGAITTATGAS